MRQPEIITENELGTTPPPVQGQGKHFQGVPHRTFAKTIETAIGEITHKKPTPGRYQLFGPGRVGMVGTWFVSDLWTAGDCGAIQVVVSNDLQSRPVIYWGDYPNRIYYADPSHRKQTKGGDFCGDMVSQMIETHSAIKTTIARAKAMEINLGSMDALDREEMDSLLVEACRRRIIPWAAIRFHAGASATLFDMLQWLRETIKTNPIHQQPRQCLEAFQLVSGK